MNKLEQQVIVWAEERGIFLKSDPKSQMMKTVSEVGELADDINKGRDCRLELGDVLVTLVLQAKMQNTTLAECLDLAYNKISQRKGEMVNGVFVREGDTV